MGKVVDAVENWVQKEILTNIINIITPRVDVALRLMNASSGRGASSVKANSEQEERVVITVSFENESEKNNKFQDFSANAETRRNFSNEKIDLSVPGTQFDRQTQNHHKETWQTTLTNPILSFSQE